MSLMQWRKQSNQREVSGSAMGTLSTVLAGKAPHHTRRTGPMKMPRVVQAIIWPRCYSKRSAAIGLSFDARSAGMKQASIARN